MIGEAKKWHNIIQIIIDNNKIVNEQPLASNKSHKLFDTILVYSTFREVPQVKLQLKQELAFEKQYLLI